MASAWVLDASPLIVLAGVGQLSLLEGLYLDDEIVDRVLGALGER